MKSTGIRKQSFGRNSFHLFEEDWFKKLEAVVDFFLEKVAIENYCFERR